MCSPISLFFPHDLFSFQLCKFDFAIRLRGIFDGFRAATVNMASFSQIAFAFEVSPALLARGVGFALLSGHAEGCHIWLEKSSPHGSHAEC